MAKILLTEKVNQISNIVGNAARTLSKRPGTHTLSFPKGSFCIPVQKHFSAEENPQLRLVFALCFLKHKFTTDDVITVGCAQSQLTFDGESDFTTEDLTAMLQKLSAKYETLKDDLGNLTDPREELECRLISLEDGPTSSEDLISLQNELARNKAHQLSLENGLRALDVKLEIVKKWMGNVGKLPLVTPCVPELILKNAPAGLSNYLTPKRVRSDRLCEAQFDWFMEFSPTDFFDGPLESPQIRKIESFPELYEQVKEGTLPSEHVTMYNTWKTFAIAWNRLYPMKRVKIPDLPQKTKGKPNARTKVTSLSPPIDVDPTLYAKIPPEFLELLAESGIQVRSNDQKVKPACTVCLQKWSKNHKCPQAVKPAVASLLPEDFPPLVAPVTTAPPSKKKEAKKKTFLAAAAETSTEEGSLEVFRIKGNRLECPFCVALVNYDITPHVCVVAKTSMGLPTNQDPPTEFRKKIICVKDVEESLSESIVPTKKVAAPGDLIVPKKVSKKPKQNLPEPPAIVQVIQPTSVVTGYEGKKWYKAALLLDPVRAQTDAVAGTLTGKTYNEWSTNLRRPLASTLNSEWKVAKDRLKVDLVNPPNSPQEKDLLSIWSKLKAKAKKLPEEEKKKVSLPKEPHKPKGKASPAKSKGKAPPQAGKRPRKQGGAPEVDIFSNPAGQMLMAFIRALTSGAKP
jgi:hypothetical protein